MKITIIMGAFLPVPPVAGGAVEKLWFALAREFYKQNHDVTMISRSWLNLPSSETCDGVEIKRVSGFNTPKNGLLLKFFDLIYSVRAARLLRNSDVVITNTFFMPFLVNQEKNGKLYVSVHRFPKGQMKFYNAASRIQCVSTAVANAVIDQVPNLINKVKVVSNFVELVMPANEVKKSWESRRNTILFVGRIHPEKGIELLLKSYSMLSETEKNKWQLDIIGPHDFSSGGGGDVFFTNLKRLADELNISVNWIDPVYDKKKLNEIYSNAKIFVYPSIAKNGEAFGLAPLEAMAQGCPSIVSNLECFSDFIKKDCNGFVFDVFNGSAEKNLLIELKKSIDMECSNELLSIAIKGNITAHQFTVESKAIEFINDFKSIIF